MAEPLTAHALNIGTWVDERFLAISAPKSIISLFIPQFAQSNTHHHVTLNKLPVTSWKDTTHTRSDFRPSFHCQIFNHPCRIYGNPSLIPYQHPQSPYWYQLRLVQQKETILIIYTSLIRSLFMYAASIYFLNASSSLVQKLQTI